MKFILRRCFALLIVSMMCVACGFADSAADFTERCAPCHGSRGAGDTKLGQNLHVRDLGSADVQKQSDDELNRTISKGRNRMPAYDRRLSKDQIDELVKYIRKLKK